MSTLKGIQMNPENIIINNSNRDGKQLVRQSSNTGQVNKIWNQFQCDNKLQSGVNNVSVQKQYIQSTKQKVLRKRKLEDS